MAPSGLLQAVFADLWSRGGQSLEGAWYETVVYHKRKLGGGGRGGKEALKELGGGVEVEFIMTYAQHLVVLVWHLKTWSDRKKIVGELREMLSNGGRKAQAG